jgi:Type II CAAX prenyl endopeptidase Rce1-like
VLLSASAFAIRTRSLCRASNCSYWAFCWGPILEESVFRGCLLPVLAQTTGNLAAVILTALLFALFHQPANLVHWVSFTATGVAYGWIRVASRSTTAGAFMHATYNLALFLSATLISDVLSRPGRRHPFNSLSLKPEALFGILVGRQWI